MKYLCLGYMDERQWEAMSESQRSSFLDDCAAYTELLQSRGNMLSAQALQKAKTAVTLQYQSGRISVTDGPYAETKEQLGGFLTLEARDLNHAIQLMSNHPGIRSGGRFEIRPIDEHNSCANRKMR
jgi:hypothetical protein